MLFYLFICEQKTAYEVRISDWSSDVCSSDLRKFELATIMRLEAHQAVGEGVNALVDQALERGEAARRLRHLSRAFDQEVVVHPPVRTEIGRASCRERVWQYE